LIKISLTDFVQKIFSFIGVGNFAAPILGGLLYEKTGINGVFGLAIGLLAIDLIMRLLVIEKKIANEYYTTYPDVSPETNPLLGSETNTSDEENQQSEDSTAEPTETQPLLRTITEPDSHYHLPPTTSTLLNTFPFYRCLSDPRLLTALFITLIQALLFGAFDATIPIIAHSYFNFTSLRAGLLFVPLGAFDLILGPVFGWCVDRYGTKPVAVLTYAFLIPVLICLRIPHPGGADQIALYAVLLALAGAGLSGTGAPSIVEAGAIAERYYETNKGVFGERGPYAQLYGMTNMVFSLGLTIGPELAGELKQVMGYGNMNAVLAGICAVTSVLSWVYIGGRTRVIFGKKSVEQ
jgi:MFS family permease